MVLMPKSIFDVMIDGEAPPEEAAVEVIERPAPPARLDLDAAKKALTEAFSKQIETLCTIAQCFTVSSDEDLDKGIDLASDLSKLVKAIEAEKKKLTQKAREYTTGVNGIANYFTERIDPAVRTIKQTLENYRRKKAIAQAEAYRKAREEQERVRKELAEEAKAKNITIDLPPPLPVPDVAKTATVTRTSSGASLGTRKDWKCTGVSDITKVPAEYLQVDMVKVNAAIKAGVKEIPGLVIEEVETSVLR